MEKDIGLALQQIANDFAEVCQTWASTTSWAFRFEVESSLRKVVQTNH